MTQVECGKLGDEKPLKGFRQPCQADALANDLYVEPPVKNPVADSHKRRGAHQERRLLKEVAAAGRRCSDLGISGDSPLRSPACFTVHPDSPTGSTVNYPKHNH